MRSLLAAAFCMAPLCVDAHPHVFIDGGADFLFEDNALTSLRISWAYDPFATLYYVQEMGVDPDGDLVLTEAERGLLLADHLSWDPGFAGDSYLEVAGSPVPLSGPQRGEARIEAGRLRIVFERDLVRPIPASGLQAVFKIYDPTYFVAYSVRQAPSIEGISHACRATLLAFDPKRDLLRLQATLAQLAQEEIPADTGVGALFADELHLICD
ncbi:MAG: DUF1007 family protein [Pseudomonadota bacterium]